MTHVAFVDRTLARFGVPPADLDDAKQEVFVIALKNGEFALVTAPQPWLYQIARRVAANRRREASTAKRYFQKFVDLWRGRRVDPLPGFDDALSLDAAVAALPTDYREAYLLVEVEGMTQLAAAETLKTSESNVRRRLAEANKLLLKALR